VQFVVILVGKPPGLDAVNILRKHLLDFQMMKNANAAMIFPLGRQVTNR